MKYLKKYNESNSNDVEEIFTSNLEVEDIIINRIDVKEVKELDNFEVSMTIDLSNDELVRSLVSSLFLLRTTGSDATSISLRNDYEVTSNNKKQSLKDRCSDLVMPYIRKLSKKYDFIIWSHRIDIDDSHRPAGSFRIRVTIQFKELFK